MIDLDAPRWRHLFVDDTGTAKFTHDGAVKAWESRDRGNRGKTAALPDVPFADVQIAYKPRHPDGHADPGEVVWADVPFREQNGQSKDRPVLVIGRTKDGKNLVGLQLSSKNGPGRRNVGEGAWDSQHRESFLQFDRFIQINERNYRKEGAYMKKPQFQDIVDELTTRQHAPEVDLALEQFTHEGAIKAWETRKANAGPQPSDTYASREDAADMFNQAVMGSVSSKSPYTFAEHMEFQNAIDKMGSTADSWGLYTTDGHVAVNRKLGGREWDNSAGYYPPEEVDKIIADLDAVLASPAAKPAPAGLLRGKSGVNSRLLEMKYKVGDTFTDKGFGSWTTDAKTVLDFTSTHFHGDAVNAKALAVRLTDAKGTKAIPGVEEEAEAILPRGLKYRVTGIRDFRGPDDTQYRLMDVEVDK